MDYLRTLLVGLPAGLKELLVSYSLTIEKLVNMKISDIADILGIDQDAARLIVASGSWK
jgi:hypothetical protein